MDATFRYVAALFSFALLAPDAAYAQTTITQTKAVNGLGGCDRPGFPVTICRPGSYKLTTNLRTSSENDPAVEISAPHVTLDLNGFAIIGKGVTGAANGVIAYRVAGSTNVTVMNGTVEGFGASGIALTGGNSRVHHVTATNNGAIGINVEEGSLVTDCTANFNFVGIQVRGGSNVVSNTIMSNSFVGLYFDTAGGYANNVMRDNGTDVVGGVQTDGNVCGTARCP